MQVKDQTVIHRNKYAILSNIIKATITLVCLYFLWIQVQENRIDFTELEWGASVKLSLAMVSLLMILNWYLEALRWKVSIESFEKIDLKEAVSSVLAGLALNWVLPFTAGDFAARMMVRKDKYQTTSAIILNRGIMLLLTSLFGLFSLRFLEQSFFQESYFYLGMMLLISSVLFFFRKKMRKFLVYFKVIEKRVLIYVTGISVLRYLIFTFQFCLLLIVFNNDLDLLIIFAGVGWIFFVRSFLPHLLGGIGLREAASVIFFASFVGDISTIILPVFLIWLINTVVPSIAGLILLWRMKLNGFRNS